MRSFMVTNNCCFWYYSPQQHLGKLCPWYTWFANKMIELSKHVGTICRSAFLCGGRRHFAAITCAESIGAPEPIGPRHQDRVSGSASSSKTITVPLPQMGWNRLCRCMKRILWPGWKAFSQIKLLLALSQPFVAGPRVLKTKSSGWTWPVLCHMEWRLAFH